MRVVFLSPAYPPEMQQYTRGLAEVGAEVYGIGDQPPESLPDSLKRCMAGYLRVPRLLDEEDVIERATEWLRGVEIDRVETNWEILVLAAARMRERWGVPGMSVDTVLGFRDKQIMKERLDAAGLRVPRAARIKTKAEARDAADRIGFPLILKPIAGAGSADTYKIESEAELEEALERMGHVEEASCEEFVEGEEFTYDTVCIDGTPAFENVAQYMPRPLIARSNEWISPIIITVRELEQPKLEPGIALGREVLRVLNMGSGFTHMEWYRTPSGEVVFGEIGCRPGGAHLVDQMNYTCDIDLFTEWARAVCFGEFSASTERKYNTAIIFKRAEGRGRIRRVEGLREYLARFAPWVTSEQLLPVGAERRNWRNTLVSDGFLIVRHERWDEALHMAHEAATGIRMFAG